MNKDDFIRHLNEVLKHYGEKINDPFTGLTKKAEYLKVYLELEDLKRKYEEGDIKRIFIKRNIIIVFAIFISVMFLGFILSMKTIEATTVVGNFKLTGARFEMNDEFNITNQDADYKIVELYSIDSININSETINEIHKNKSIRITNLTTQIPFHNIKVHKGNIIEISLDKNEIYWEIMKGKLHAMVYLEADTNNNIINIATNSPLLTTLKGEKIVINAVFDDLINKNAIIRINNSGSWSIGNITLKNLYLWTTKGTPKRKTSSIIEGNIELPKYKYNYKLYNKDFLELEFKEISNFNLLYSKDTITVNFEGKANRVDKNNISLTPSLLESIYYSNWVSLWYAAAIFILGIYIKLFSYVKFWK